MNSKLIKQLKEERDRLYPKGWDGSLIFSRGCGKTKTMFVSCLRYEAYEQLLKILVELPEMTNYDDAQKWIYEFIRLHLPENY